MTWQFLIPRAGEQTTVLDAGTLHCRPDGSILLMSPSKINVNAANCSEAMTTIDASTGTLFCYTSTLENACRGKIGGVGERAWWRPPRSADAKRTQLAPYFTPLSQL